jgi:glycerol-3-phosphate dehydrogenase
VTVVGGKLTTYRRMAEDAVDAALERTALSAGPCRTKDLPLLGAASREALARVEAPARLVRRYGTEAPALLAHGRSLGCDDTTLLAPVVDGLATTTAELLWGVGHEGALDVGDLLDRRTRIGLVPADRVLAEPAAEQSLALHSALGR